MVRERNSSLGTGGLCFGDVVFAARRGRLAGAALLGEVRVAGHGEVSYNRRFRIQNLQHRSRFFSSYHKDNAEQIFCGSGEGAPVHISEDAAWRCGPTLVIESWWHLEMVRPSRSRFLRRDRERTGPRQLRQPKWRSTTAGPHALSLEISRHT